METTFIYVLKDPTTQEIRYVGKSNDPKRRLSKHLNNKKDLGTHKRNWLNTLTEKPILEVIKEFPKDEWQKHEKYYIEYYLSLGCDLVNWGDGGEGLTYGNQTSYKKGQGGKKIVLLNELGEYVNTFNSGKDVTKFIGKRGLSSVLNGKSKTCGGYICLYEENYKNMTTEEIDNFVKNSITDKGYSNLNIGEKYRFKKGEQPWNTGKHYENHKKRKIVYQYDKKTKEFIREWNGIVEIVNELKYEYDNINNNTLNKTKSSYGYIWTYTKIE